MRPGSVRSDGYAYLAMLIGIAVLGISLSTAATVWHEEIRREKEVELLFVGLQFQRAILQYYESSPGQKRYPAQLADLLRDARYPGTRRHLRQIYRDPITNKTDWGLIRAPEGGIMGVYSMADGVPIKRAGFGVSLVGFDEAPSYQEWQFVYRVRTF